MTEFTTGVQSRDGLVLAELHGRLDGSAATAMEALHAQLVEPGVSGLLIDFGDVEYINSTGIALIVGLAAKAWTAQLPILACGLTEHYEHIFTITRIADFVHTYPTQADALDAHEAAGGAAAPAPAG